MGKRKARTIVDSRVGKGGITYQLELIRCGKPACKRCPHGPYWYAYVWDPKRKRLASRYIGRTLRELASEARNGKSNSKRSRTDRRKPRRARRSADRELRRAI